MNPDKRRTTVHDRFEIGCSLCGRLGGEKSRSEAVQFAKHMKTLHTGHDEAITIYDVMGHPGCPYLWDSDGNEIREVMK